MTPEIPYVSLRITDDCNAGPACKTRCYSNEGFVPTEASTEGMIAIIHAVARAGTTTLGIMGGEPLLREDLPVLAREAKASGLQVVLSTNTLSLTPEKLCELAPLIDWLSISLEADTPRVNNALRGKGQFEAVGATLDLVSQLQPDFRVKVNTQVTAVNKDQIQKIPAFFNDRVDVWKLLQWIPRAEARKVMNVFAVSLEEFNDILGNLRRAYPTLNIADRPYPEPDPDSVIIRPNGDVLVSDQEFDYTCVGNLLQGNGDELHTAAKRYTGLSANNAQRFKQSYPGS